MMRFQPSSLSNLQRQSLLESLGNIRLTHHWSRQRSVEGSDSCCHQARRIANATAACGTVNRTSIATRQQQRHFAVSRIVRESLSPPPEPSSFDKGKEKERDDPDISTAKGRWKKLGFSSTSAPSNSIDATTTAQKANKAESPKRRVSRKPDEQAHTEALKAGRPWFAPLLRLKDPPLRYAEDAEAYRLEVRVAKMRKAVGKFHRLWNRVKGESQSIAKHIEIAMWFADYGIQCRRIREDKVNHLAIMSQIGVYLEEMIIYIEVLRKGGTDTDGNARFLLQCLRVRSLSFQDKQEEARQQLIRLLKENEEWLEEDLKENEEQPLARIVDWQKHLQLESLANAVGAVLQTSLDRCSISRDKTSAEIAEETMDWLHKHPILFRFNSLHFTRHIFRFNVLTSMLNDPLHYIKSRADSVDIETLSTLTSSICRCLLRESAVLSTYKIYRWTLEARVRLQESVLRQLIRLATLEGESFLAARVVNDLLKQTRNGKGILEQSTCRAMAVSSARRRDEKKMEEVLDLIGDHYRQDTAEFEKFAFEARILCYSRQADITKTVSLVEQRYDMHIAPNEQPEEGLLYPDYEVHSRLVQTYIAANERDQAEIMLHRMVQFGHRPDASLLAYILEYYARFDDLASTLALYRQMRNSAVEVDARTCTSLIALFAKRKDSVSAFKVLETMQKDGITPDRTSYNALLNAYVEAGDWQAAMDLFEWMRHNRRDRLQPNSTTYNTMLKAHVLRALPVQEIFNFFQRIMEAGVDPDAYTLSLVLQSVCDAGLMDLAEQIFSSIEDRLGDLQGKPEGKGAGIWHFTLMIQGYLRSGQIETAREYANELRKRGLTATGVLWSVLVKAYGAQEEDESLEASHGLAQSALFTNPKEYVGAYQPLIEMHSKRGSVQQVELLLQELADKEADIPIHLWTALMDAFRRQGNLVGTMDTWNLIFNKALEIVRSNSYIDDADTKDVAKAEKNIRSNLLCLPLSILIDTLASQGEHERIAQEWLRCRQAGFAFDSHNWNHLCAAFLSAGRIVDSLNIINRVLPNEPPRKTWRELEIAALPKLKQEYKSSFEGDEAVKTASPSRPPNRRHQNRVRDDVDAQYPLEGEDESRRLRKDGLVPSDHESHLEEGNSTRSPNSRSDQSSILQYLQKQAMRDEVQSSYYPHFETMTALEEAVESIKKSGGSVKVKDRTISIQEVMEEYPRVEYLLAQYREKVDLLQEFARTAAIQDQESKRFPSVSRA